MFTSPNWVTTGSGSGEGGGGITSAEVTAIVDAKLKPVSNKVTTLETSVTSLSSEVTALTTTVNEHISNKNNPHGVTPAQIGAATADHTHTLDDLGAAAKDHNHDEAYAALDHTHTASSIGAATATHTHTYSDVTGVAAADHNHDAVYAPKSHSHTLSEISDYEEIPVYVGATEDAVGITGTVPAASIGDRNKFLRGDGTYGQDDTKADLSGATFTGGVFEIPVTVSPSQNVTITVSNGNTQVITINEATTFSFSGTPENTACCFSLALTNGDSYTVTWPENIKWHNGTSPTLAHISILTFITVDGGTTWYGVLSIAAL